MTEKNENQVATASSGALRSYAKAVRKWSGWPTATLVFGKPDASPFADCNHNSKVITVDLDRVLLNPNRVLNTVTPFRMKQEAVLTGVLLHECAHAQYSHWIPRDDESRAAFVHSDGTPVTEAELELARLMEEARVEGRIVRNAADLGISDLTWTLRASAAHLLPVTTLSEDPDQQLLELIRVWALRVGRLHAQRTWLRKVDAKKYMYAKKYIGPWENRIRDMLKKAVFHKISRRYPDKMFYTYGECEEEYYDYSAYHDDPDEIDSIFEDPDESEEPSASTGLADSLDESRRRSWELFNEVLRVMDTLESMAQGWARGWKNGQGYSAEDGESEDTSTFMVDQARTVITILFPGQENLPAPMALCGGSPGSGDQPDGGDSESGDSSEGEGAEGEGAEGEGAEGAEGEGAEGEGAAARKLAEMQREDTRKLAEELRAAELEALDQEEEAAKEAGQASTDPSSDPTGRSSQGASAPNGAPGRAGWRSPTKADREMKARAERFLRGVINPSEKSVVALSDSPSAKVDGAALAAWKAGDRSRPPRFFVHTRREVQPTPPVRIAILVDISGSMDSLQGPSALLSWSLSAAAFDLQNFAGRGQQVESCLVHWGNNAEVIQKPGQLIPGIREVNCGDGTWAMGDALRLVENELPGFFDAQEEPSNRLLVQFTDWELPTQCLDQAVPFLDRGMMSGVNMLSIMPPGSIFQESQRLKQALGRLSDKATGTAPFMRYNALFSDRVWEHAAEVLQLEQSRRGR